MDMMYERHVGVGIVPLSLPTDRGPIEVTKQPNAILTARPLGAYIVAECQVSRAPQNRTGKD